MKHVFWLVENELCGRPGPNLEPWQPADFLAHNIRAILSVNSGESVYQDELEPLGIKHLCVPLAASAPPAKGELELCLERLPIAFTFVREQVETRSAVLVHCRHGKDRTGLFMAYYLKRCHGLSTSKAIEQVLQARPIALTANGWLDFANEVLETANI